ncbi:MAG: M1 family metallopeptidase [Chitinophagales bacterium]|nr:M1 family metallopeptidase [Chitinophagales bacterium]
MKNFLPILISYLIIQQNLIDRVQAQPLYIPRNVAEAFENKTRAPEGNPGINYWQNRGDYALKISFDPESLLLNGKETITYYNDSPDTLKKVVIHLYPNFYKKGFARNYPINREDENEGVTLESLSIGKEQFEITETAKVSYSGTNLTVLPDAYILPKSKTVFNISWHYTVNKGSHVRTGLVDSSTFFLAYTFPRIAVYDDIDGWNEWDYVGMQEFYNDWGSFDAEISVPRGFIVWATGELQNAAEVLSRNCFSRYQRALISDQIVHIIDSSDYKSGIVTADASQLTWKFNAKDVTDFAFALSNHYLWDGSSITVDSAIGRRVFVDAAYNKDSKDFFEVADVARKCIDIMSHKYPAVPFPFPKQTIFNGLDQMEYPMMVNDNSTDTREEMVQLTSHEIIHAYFPFYVGTNETKYAWMDEGWATIGESVISPMLGEPEDDGIYMRSSYERIAGTDEEMPMITNSQLIYGGTYFTNSYGKAGIFYWALQHLLGDELFFNALHEYINRWHGKHPTPYDFFNTFNNVSGKDLNWFIRPWFFETGYPDLAIKEVSFLNAKWKVIVERKGIIPVPVFLTYIFQNDSTIEVDATAEVWQEGKTEFVIEKYLSGKLKEVRLGSSYVPDINHDDNRWEINNSR